MRYIQGILMTRRHTIIRFNEGKLINGHNLPIMEKIHHSKECGHYRFHGVNIITPKEHIKIQGTLDYHNIDTENFSFQSNGQLRKDP